MSARPSAAPEVAEQELLPHAPALHLVPGHEHAWALRDVEYDNGLSLNRFECESCNGVRFT